MIKQTLETKDLILTRSKKYDVEKLHNNFLGQEDTAKYMLWSVTKSPMDAKEKMEKWLESHRLMYLAYEKESDEPIGFVTIDELKNKPTVFGDIGICVGKEYLRKGYGSQMLNAVCTYCQDELCATKFIYSHMEGNIASERLAKKFGFQCIGTKKKMKAGRGYKEIFYERDID
ncbi:MAG: GNAT family N-acetyltransferase [Clostridiales bacterium]|nr:GNAT family N-acetyltransferase [Clostridiales bacterium]